MKRNEFLHVTATGFAMLANGRLLQAADMFDPQSIAARSILRFAVASDGHYGEKNTDYASHFSTLVRAINKEHRHRPFQFVVVNGDIVHDDKNHYPAAKKALDNFRCPYYVSQGNHDHVSPEEWESIWNMPVNHSFVYGNRAFLIGTTSDIQGNYLCPDIAWMAKKLEQHKFQDVYIFIHINPGALTKNAVDCQVLFDLFERYPNIRAVFNGHDHDEEGIKWKNRLPFLFDAHFGGSWGTAYRGYRVVEIMRDGSVVTYLMNPEQMINRAVLAHRPGPIQ